MTMKYVTFFQFNEDDNVYEELSGDFVPSTSTFFLLDSFDGQVSIAKVEDDFDFSRLTDESISKFSISIHETIEDLREFVNSNSAYRSDVSYVSPDIFCISSPPPFDLTRDYVDRNSQPFDEWIWDEDESHWSPPVQKPILSNGFSCTWNQLRLNWDIEIKNQPERKYKGYQLWKPIPKKLSKIYENACSANDYTIKSFEEVTHGTITFDSEITAFHGIPDADIQGRGPFTVIKRHEMVVDAAPVAFITYSELDEMYIHKVGTQKIWSTHPQCMAHEMHELFRMIIEWAWAHTELGNNEPLAITCHDLLRALQMPANVRNDLLQGVPPQPVAKYILNDRTALVKDTASSECPESFKYWIMDVYRLFAKRATGQQVYIDTGSLQNSYPL